MNKIDAFTLTFDALRAVIQDPHKYSSSEDHKSLLGQFDRIFEELVTEESVKTACSTFSLLQRHRSNVMALCRQNSEKCQSQIAMVDSLYDEAALSCDGFVSSARRRIKMQRSVAERRMKELVFEIIGEYGKSDIRLLRRRGFVQFSARFGKVLAAWGLLWQRLALRLYQEVVMLSQEGGLKPPQLQCSVLGAVENMDELSRIKARLSSHVGHAVYVMAAVRLRKITSSEPSVVPSSKRLFAANTLEEVAAFSGVLSEWVAVKQKVTKAPGSGRRPSTTSTKQFSGGKSKFANLDVFLRSSIVEWLHPASYATPQFRRLAQRVVPQTASPFEAFCTQLLLQSSAKLESDRLYFCLEERAAATAALNSPLLPNLVSKSESSDLPGGLGAVGIMETMQILQNIYASSKGSESDASTLASDLLTVTARLDKHRKPSLLMQQSQSDYLFGFPDVVETRDSSGQCLHFSPAIMLNLVETAGFASLSVSSDELRAVAAQVPHPSLSRLHNAAGASSPLKHLYCMVRVPTRLLAGQQDSIAGVQNDGSLLVMIPLSAPSMTHLLRQQLALRAGPAEAFMSMNATSLSSSFSQLLPDHPLERVTDARSQLRHQYYLLYDEGQSDRETSGKQQRPGTATGAATAAVATSTPEVRGPCYYFVQAMCSEDATRLGPITGSNVDLEDLSTQLSAVLKGGPGPADPSLAVIQRILSLQQHFQSDVVPKSRSFTSLPSQKRLSDVSQSEDGAAAAPVGRQPWDSRVLSTVCRWRSCLCEASPASISSDKWLCQYHEELRQFLDEAPQPAGRVALEAAKFLPKSKGPAFPTHMEPFKKDIMTVRAASTLLQEMWDGKLKSTLQVYIKKTAKEFGVRHRLETRSCAAVDPLVSLLQRKRQTSEMGPPKRPSWAIWRDESEFERSMQRLTDVTNALQSVITLEKQVSEELAALASVKVFPSPELAMIRKDMKVFKEAEEGRATGQGQSKEEAHAASLSMLELERQMCDRKLGVLRQRRLEEEEARALIARKQARLKAQEELQAKDPTSFKNQRSR